MKNLFVILFMWAGCAAYAQDEVLVSIDAKRVTPSEIPPSVIEALKKDFPSMEVMEYYLFPSGKINSEWSVTEEDNLESGDVPDHYNILIKGTKGGYVNALYDKNGELKTMKILALDFALPASIRTAATTGKYAGYQIKSDKFVRVVNKKKEKEYIEVVVAKANSTKKLYFTPDGKLMKEK